MREDLARCLDSLQEGARGLRTETIVVDNASTDGSPQMVQERFPQVQVLQNDFNAGFAGANVQALAIARGRYLLLLNPDTLVPPDGLAQLVAFADQHPRAGVVGPRLVYGDGRLQHSCRCFPTIAAAVFRGTWLGALFPRARAQACYLMDDWAHDEVRQVDWLSGACMMIRREAFEQVGTLDVGFYWGSEDVDFCWRMHKAGWEVVYTPQPTIVHFVGRSTDQAVLRTILRSHRSMYRLYSKHLARSALGRALVWLGVWIRAGLLILQYAIHWLPLRIRRAMMKRREAKGA